MCWKAVNFSADLPAQLVVTEVFLWSESFTLMPTLANTCVFLAIVVAALHIFWGIALNLSDPACP